MTTSKHVVYIIDDDASVRSAFKRIVDAHGYDARVFASARAFLAAGQPAANSCLVLDVIMPEMDGFQLQQELIQAGNNVPIIFVTGLDNPEIRENVKQGRVECLLRKPVDVHVLLDAINLALVSRAFRPATAKLG